MTRHVALFAAVALVGGLGAAGCAHDPLPPAQMVIVESPAQARVTLKDVHRDIYSFEVLNMSDHNLVIERDAIMLVTHDGERVRRQPGGVMGLYTVPPGGAQEVRVRYDKNATARAAYIDFNGALLVDGRLVGMPLVSLANVAMR